MEPAIFRLVAQCFNQTRASFKVFFSYMLFFLVTLADCDIGQGSDYTGLFLQFLSPLAPEFNI